MLSDPSFWVFIGAAAQVMFNWFTIRRQDAAEEKIRWLQGVARRQSDLIDSLLERRQP